MENLKNIQPVEDFNWDAFEQGETYTEVSKDDLVKTYDETLNTVKDKEVVMGTVTSMNKREVVVNIGFKSDGVVPMSEFRYNPDLKIGDEVEVYIESQEDKKGQLILSHKHALHVLGIVLTRLLKKTKLSKVTSNVVRRAV